MGKDSKKDKDRDRLDDKMEKKLHETREEKMLRRLEKKKRKRELEEASKTICGYTDENNRFGDSSLTQAFVWSKKKDKDGEDPSESQRLSEKEKRRYELERKIKIEEEVEKVKRRREEREKETAWMEEEKARMARESEEAQHHEWELKADEFHLEQARLRAKIRTTEGRAKPIDIVAKNLMGDEMEVEMTEPYKLFKNLTLGALEELLIDIGQHQALDKKNADFWDAMVIVCDDEIVTAKAREERARQGKSAASMEGGVHSAIQNDIVQMFQGKSWRQLQQQEDEIRENLGGDALDPEFAEAVLAQIKIAKAKAKLKEFHEEVLRKRLAMLEGQLAEESMAYEPTAQKPSGADKDESSWDAVEMKTEQQSDDSDDENAGSYSPVLDQEYKGEDVVDAEADKIAIEQQRKAILAAETNKFKAVAQSGNSEFENALYQAEASKGLDQDEAIFSTEVNLENQVYSWHDKYRPRKPRFFNRVHTGYEWNKYNQTHYDHDNPPPKIVQGYKFNIFYPDLIDKSKAPTFRLENDKDSDTKIIRFMAGPPYEDIAFRIVNKEWEYSHRKGFKCTFDRGILHLYFNFMRHRYRR